MGFFTPCTPCTPCDPGRTRRGRNPLDGGRSLMPLTIFHAGGTPRAPGRFGRGRCTTAAGRTGLLVLLLGWVVLGFALGGCTATPAGAPMISGGHASGGGRGPQRRITQEELTQRLMAFADRYLSRISEATDQLK